MPTRNDDCVKKCASKHSYETYNKEDGEQALHIYIQVSGVDQPKWH